MEFQKKYAAPCVDAVMDIPSETERRAPRPTRLLGANIHTEMPSNSHSFKGRCRLLHTYTVPFALTDVHILDTVEP